MKSEIRNWYSTHGPADGDFYTAEKGDLVSVIPPTSITDTVLYCTKRHCVGTLISKLDGQPSFAAILRGGLPLNEEVDWLRATVGLRRFLFLGDADSADLLIFAWLRQHMPVHYVGLNDKILGQCGVQIADNMTIRLGDSEMAALPLVTRCLSDLPGLLGEHCSGLLSSGRKVELEVLFNCSQCDASVLEAAILGESV